MVDINWDSKIIINDPYLEGELCDWYGILRTFRIRSNLTKNIIRFSLDREQAIEQFKYLIDGERLDTKFIDHFRIIDGEIKTYVRRLLRTYGISDDAECELFDYKKDTQSFSVKVGEKILEVSLKYPNEFTRKSRVSIGDYWASNEYVIDRYKSELDYELIAEQKCNVARTSHRSFDTKHYYFNLYEGNENIFISIKYPEELEDKYNNIYFDNGVLERALMSCEELPIIDVYEVVVRTLNSMGYRYDNFPSIFIQKTKDYDTVNDEVTDRIDISNGEFESFIYTKKDRKVTVAKSGAWTVEDKAHKVSNDKNGKIDINLYTNNNTLLDLTKSPADIYNDAAADAEVVSLLSKSLIEEAKKRTM